MPFLLSASLGFMCGIVGSLFGGYECEMVGRKACLIIQSTLTFCGLLLMSFAPSFLVLLIGRAIHGYSTGALTGAVPIYISELCQPQIRSFTGTLNLSVYALSTGAVFVIGAMVHWRVLILICSGAPLLTIFMLLFASESMPCNRIYWSDSLLGADGF